MLLLPLAAAPSFVRHGARAGALPVVGYLCPETPARFASRLRAFHAGLAETGHADGRTLTMDYRWADGDYRRLPSLATELVRSQVSVLVAPGGAPTGLAAKAVAEGTPIIFEMGGDPIQLGVVDRLSRPSGNITGVSSLSVEVSRKRLEFMRDIRPRSATLAVALNPTSPTAKSQLESLRMAAETLKVDLLIVEASREAEFESMFQKAAELADAGIVFTSDPYFAFRSDLLASLAAHYDVPAITQSRDFPDAGGLLSYGGDFVQSHRRTGQYTGQILNGARPMDLPVQLVTKVELVANLRAARALGVDLPSTLINAADEVLE